MGDYIKNFFSEESSIYSNNTLNLFKIFNDEEYLLNNFDKFKTNLNFLEFIIPNQIFLEKIFKKDKLYIYTIIDFYDEKYNISNIKKKNIHELLNNQNFSIIENIWDDLKNYNIDITNYEDLINYIQINSQDFFFYLFNKRWVNNIETKIIDDKDLQVLGEQLLVFYYFDLFYKDNKNFLINKKTNYNTFIKLINIYNNVYLLDYEKKDIIFYKIEKKDNIFCKHDFKEYLKLFFYFSLENKVVNKNIIMWFYIFFKDYISKQLQNDYLNIIFEYNENLLGFINNLFQQFGKEFYEYTEDEMNEILDYLKNNEYIYKTTDDDVELNNKTNLYEITNNLFLLKNLNKEKKDYSIIKIEGMESLPLDNLYFMFLFSPLENSFKTIIENITDLTLSINDKFTEINNINDINVYYFYNSAVINNFNENNYFFTDTIINYNNLQDFDFIKKYFNIEVLYYKILIFLGNYEIIPNIYINLKNNIENYKYKLESVKKIYLNIYPQEKEVLNGYKKS